MRKMEIRMIGAPPVARRMNGASTNSCRLPGYVKAVKVGVSSGLANDGGVYVMEQFNRHVILVSFISLCVVKYTKCTLHESEYAVTYLRKPNERIPVEVKEVYDKLRIFCYEGEGRRVANILKTCSVRILAQTQNYEVFHGVDIESVLEEYKESKGFFHILPWRSNCINIAVYNFSCIGIQSDMSYSVFFEVRHVDLMKVARLLSGLFLFLAAPYLASNVVFYYISGVLLGITASLLIIVFIVSRMIPRRVGAVTVLFGGWAIVLYFLQLMISNLKTIFVQYQNYVIGYLTVVGFISFVICYKYGQVTDTRTRNLIQWTLQAAGLLLIFVSTEWREVAVGIMLVVLAFYNFPASWSAKIRTYWRRRFPPKLRLLREDEYYDQAARETRKALQELRKYCRSPECQSWKLVKRLNSPLRFADFIEGGSHLTDEEILNYETDLSFTRDDSDNDTDNEHLTNGGVF